MRSEATEAEARLWNALRAHGLGGWKWKRQVPCGPFIADFLCEGARLIVELDGGQHSERQAYDARRTAFLTTLGYGVVRFWNFEVMEDRDAVCRSILDACGGDRPGWDSFAECSLPIVSSPRVEDRGRG